MKKKSELLQLKYVGPKIVQALESIGITSIKKMAQAHVEQLSVQLEEVTGRPTHPCLQDILSAAIHEARTGGQVPWWFWSKQRKMKSKSLEW